MNELLGKILEAHGGLELWKQYQKDEATIVSGRGLFPLKGVPQDSSPRRMTVWLHEERSSVFPYGAPDQRTMFTPGRVAVEKLDGTLVAERHAPRDSFAGHQMGTPWDSLHRAYFNGYALWTYLTTPFLLASDGVSIEETEPWRKGAETWRVLRAYFPGSVETHNLVQDFFFGEDLMLRRHDYSVNVAGGFAAAQLTSDYVTADGVRLPTKRRAYTRGPDQVLNAFRHHWNLHITPLSDESVELLCSTPFGITGIFTLRTFLFQFVECMLNAFRHHWNLHTLF